MNETVKYNNDMNLLKFKGFTKVDMNILMVLCSKMKDKDIQEITLSFRQIKELSNFTSTDKKDFIQALDEMTDRLIKVNSKIITNGKIMKFILFPTFVIDEDNETLTIGVNKDFTFLLNDLKAFTIFELAEFVELSSKYSKNLYRLLKQFRTTGKLIIDDIEDFKEKLDSPTSYKTKDFKRFVLDVAINELKEKEYFKNLKVEPTKAKTKGRAITGYIFTFEPEQVKRKPTLKADECTNGKPTETKEQNRQQSTPNKKTGTGTTKTQKTSTPLNHRFNQFPQRNYSDEQKKEIETQALQLKEKEVSERTLEQMKRLDEKYPNLRIGMEEMNAEK